MKVTIEMPEEYMGDIMGDVTARRGRVDGMEPRGNAQVVNALYHFQKCSVMQLHYVLTLKVAVLTLCTLTTMQKFLNQSLMKSSRKIKVNNITC